MLNMSNEDLFEIVTGALNRMNNSLTGHGERVAYQMVHLLAQNPAFTEEEICKLSWIALFHDIGNFTKDASLDLKRLEHDRSEFHEKYGYVFLKHFAPFRQYLPVVRYHHAPIKAIWQAPLDEKIKWAALYLRTADMIDLYQLEHPDATWYQAVSASLRRLAYQGNHEQLDEIYQYYREQDLYDALKQEDIHQDMLILLQGMQITEERKRALLKTLVCAMDFRSHYTALHCSIMVRASDILAQKCGLDERLQEQVHFGAMLHDLGKIAIPIEILESPNKLSGEDWEIMKSHVKITEEILRGHVSDEVLQIAIRHHETLDGKGYPYGIGGEELTLPQRIVAVGDILSALTEERSYKPAFSMEEVVRILTDLRDKGKICPYVFSVFCENQELIAREIMQTSWEITKDFQDIYSEYYALPDIS